MAMVRFQMTRMLWTQMNAIRDKAYAGDLDVFEAHAQICNLLGEHWFCGEDFTPLQRRFYCAAVAAEFMDVSVE